MRKLITEITQRLQSFVNQRDDLALVVCSPAADAAPLLKMLEGLEEMSTSDLYWVHSDDFVEPDAYVGVVVKAFANKHEAMRLAMEKNAMKPWPPLPEEILSEDLAAAERLRSLAAFSRELLPVPNGGSVIWVFFPLQIGNPFAYATLMQELLRHEFPFPWCHHLRFIIREDPADRALQKILSTSPRIQWYEPDLSTDALNRSMEEEVADDNVSLAERINTLLVMAALDCAHKRFKEALEKYELVLQYYAPMGNHAMAALALNGMGEIYAKTGDLERANDSFEAALIPAGHGELPPIPVLLNVVLNLANLRQTEERWEDAEAYFDMSQQLATANRDAFLTAHSIENRGVCQLRQGKLDDAGKSWNDALVLAAQLQDVQLCQGLLKRLRKYYADTGQAGREREVQEQLAAFKT